MQPLPSATCHRRSSTASCVPRLWSDPTPTRRPETGGAPSGSDQLHQLRQHALRQGDLGLRELLAQAHELVSPKELAGPRKHLGLFLLGVMLHEVLEDLGLGRERLGGGVGALELGEHGVDYVMLLLCLEIELAVLRLLRGVAECGIEDLLLDGGVDLELALDLREELLPLRGRPLGALGELTEEPAHFVMILLQEGESVLLRRMLPGPGHGNSPVRRRWPTCTRPSKAHARVAPL